MTFQSTDTARRRTDPFRWEHDRITQARDDFAQPDPPPSQRRYAHEHAIPRSTLGSWLRQTDPDGVDPALTAFLRCAAGQACLRRLVLALFLVFQFRGACGLRLLGLFLRLTGLDRFVAASHGALHTLSQTLQTDLATFGDEERARLAPGMTARDIALVADEHFHGDDPCLVACEPVSNFLVLEQYAARRDAATWTAALTQAVADLPVTVVLLGSDQARGLLACARDGLQAQHLPELFHGQRDLGRPLLGSLQRQHAAAAEQLPQAQEQAQRCQEEAAAAAATPRPGRPKDYSWRLQLSRAQVQWRQQQLQACAARQQQAQEALRGLADDYHPFDRQTGAAVDAAAMAQRLEQRLQTLEQVAQQAEVGGKVPAALAKGRRWTQALVAALAWFWALARTKVSALDLPEEVEQVVYAQWLPGLYWQQAARRARSAAPRRQQEALAGRLWQQAWSADSALHRLGEEERQAWERVGQEIVGLFARSSSCVEGRNGRPSLFHHGHCRLSAARLQALTVVHNYVSERADGTTAAERLFGRKPRAVFDWLLERLPDLPRPAAKRPRKGSQPSQTSG